MNNCLNYFFTPIHIYGSMTVLQDWDLNVLLNCFNRVWLCNVITGSVMYCVMFKSIILLQRSTQRILVKVMVENEGIVEKENHLFG